jgi:hypothetical protein
VKLFRSVVRIKPSRSHSGTCARSQIVDVPSGQITGERRGLLEFHDDARRKVRTINEVLEILQEISVGIDLGARGAVLLENLLTGFPRGWCPRTWCMKSSPEPALERAA